MYFKFFFKSKESLSTELFDAIKKNRLDKVTDLIRQGADIKAIDDCKETPLHKAAKSGYLEILKLLIANDANVNATNNLGETPLHKAASFENLEAVVALIDAGADVNAINNIKGTPLHATVSSGSLDILNALITAGANVTAKSIYGVTPLHNAVIFENLEAVVALIDAGADINAINNSRKTSLKLTHQTPYQNPNEKARIVKKLIENFALPFEINQSKMIDMSFQLFNKDAEINRALQKQLLDLGIIELEGAKDSKQIKIDSAQKIYKIDDEFIKSKLKELETLENLDKLEKLKELEKLEELKIENSPPTLKELTIKAVAYQVTKSNHSHTNKESFEKAIKPLELPSPLPEDLKNYKYPYIQKLKEENKIQAQIVWIKVLNAPFGDVKSYVEENLLTEILPSGI